jgi:hypothetical protein
MIDRWARDDVFFLSYPAVCFYPDTGRSSGRFPGNMGICY